MKPKLIFQITFLFLIYGCECYPTAKGIIIDEVTRMPIENAQIQFGKSKTLSNNNGQFEISSSDCDSKLIVAKDKYKPFVVTVTNKNNKINIELDNEIKYKDPDKPKYINPDSTSYLVSQGYNSNSVHFEYAENIDSLKIYLTKVEK